MRGKNIKIAGVGLIVLLTCSESAHSFCFEAAANHFNIAPQIIMSIAQNESQMNPTAVNYNTDGSYDYGVMQINSTNASQLRSVGINWNTLADPCTNVMAGTWLLSLRIQEYGYNWKGIGAYHSKTPSKRDSYAKKIAKLLPTFNGASYQQQAMSTGVKKTTTLPGFN